MDGSIALAVLLFAAGIIFIVAEVFIPSGGILTIVALISLILSYIMAFNISSVVGVVFIVATIVILPFLISKLLKIFPNTFFGKLIMLEGPKKHEDVAISSEKMLKSFIGKHGITKSMLRPSGIAEIDGERVDVVSEGMLIEKESIVKVIETHGNALVVKLVEKTEEQSI
ncbi:MAG: NfeD family protein [Planctomycetota bacterium]